MRRATINRKKAAKLCGFMGEPCVQDDCAIYYGRFGRCSIELLPDNLYGATRAMSHLAESITPLMEAVESIERNFEPDDQRRDEQLKLF